MTAIDLEWDAVAAEYAVGLEQVLATGPDTPERAGASERWKSTGARARALAERSPAAAWRWILRSTRVDRRNGGLVMWLMAAAGPPPPEALDRLVDFAVEEACPSFDRIFVEPAIQAFGAERVLAALCDRLDGDDPRAVAGAAQALYWAKVLARDLDPAALDRERASRLRAFLRFDDVQAQRSLVAGLDLDPSRYAEELRPRVADAIDRARGSRDEYVRHRVEVRLGRRPDGLLMPLPDLK